MDTEWTHIKSTFSSAAIRQITSLLGRLRETLAHGKLFNKTANVSDGAIDKLAGLVGLNSNRVAHNMQINLRTTASRRGKTEVL